MKPNSSFARSRPASRGKIVFAVTLGIAALVVTLPAKAQTIEGNIHYYTDTATINTNILGHDVVIGKMPGGTFAKAAGDTDILTPYTLTIANGAKISDGSGGANGYLSVNAYNNTTLNILGGTVEVAWGFGNSQVNISGGKVHDATSSGGLVNINGGTVDVSYANGSKAVVNVHGGAVGNSNSFFSLRNSGGTFNVSGGAIGGSTTGYSYLGFGTLNVTGGTLASQVYNYGGTVNISAGNLAAIGSSDATVNVTGGTMGNISLFGASLLNLTGNGFTTNVGAAHWGYDENNGTLGWVSDYTITGSLADGTAFNKTITAAANDSTLGANSIQLQGQSHENAPDLYVTDNGSVHDAYNSVTIGLSEDGSILASPNVTLDTGFLSGFVGVLSGSNVTLNDGIAYGGIFAQDNSTVNVVGGNTRFTIGVGSATINIQGGTIGEVDGSENSLTNITGGSIGNSFSSIIGDTNAVINLSGGQLSGAPVRLLGNSTLDVLGTALGFASIGTGADGFGDYKSYRLFGTLLDGNSISGLTFYDYLDGGYDIGKGPGNSPLLLNGISAAAPEPGALALVATGLLPLAGTVIRRRRIIRA